MTSDQLFEVVGYLTNPIRECKLDTEMKEFENKVFHCDNREIFEKLPDNSIDLIITDPPYKDYQSNRPVAHEKVKKINEIGFDIPYFIAQCTRVLKPGCHFYCWCDHLTFSDLFQEIRTQFQKAKSEKSTNFLIYKNCLIWVKNNHGTGDLKGDWAPQHEFVIFATKGKGKNLNGKRQPNVFFRRGNYGIEFYKKVSNYNFEHGTSKPVAVLNLMIEASSEKGDLVFDPYGGSMSLGEACIETNRNYLLVEIEEEHYLNGVKRLEICSSQLKLFGD